MKNSGKVYLIGAGPGDPGLITVKAKRLLSTCDAVVYDHLLPLELVVTLPKRIERYFVGKSTARHFLPQEDINTLLVDLAQQGKRVVRLKGGDPFVFGRGGEEALYLRKKGIPFEVVPGITAGVGVAAYAGIPVTHRKKSVFTIMLTAHEAVDKAESQVPWDWLGRTENGTIIGYMGVKQLSHTVERLISHGMNPETPAALVEKGTTGVQKSITGTLKRLAELASEAHISPPALFIIGEVVPLADKLHWYGNGILSGKKTMVTRPADQAGEMYAMLREAGAEVLPLPTITTEPCKDEAGWKEFPVFINKGANCWLVFTSENGVRYFVSQLFDRGYDYRVLGHFNIAAMGSGTDRALQYHHLKADFIPSSYTSDVLSKELADHIEGTQAYVIRVRGNLGDERVEKALAGAGANVVPLQVYDTQTAEWDAGMRVHFDENKPDIITFTSGSTVTGLVEILGKEKAVEAAGNAVVASIGPMTTRIAKEQGLPVTLEAKTHSVPGLVEAIIKYFS
jgi:uroporphyrinogen III methyltransferase/synthase